MPVRIFTVDDFRSKRETTPPRSVAASVAPTEIGSHDNRDNSFNETAFKQAFIKAIVKAAGVTSINTYICSLKRNSSDGYIDIVYTFSKESAGNNLLTLVSLMSTFILSGAMSEALRKDGLKNYSSNSPDSFVSFLDKSTKKTIITVQVTQVSYDFLKLFFLRFLF